METDNGTQTKTAKPKRVPASVNLTKLMQGLQEEEAKAGKSNGDTTPVDVAFDETEEETGGDQYQSTPTPVVPQKTKEAAANNVRRSKEVVRQYNSPNRDARKTSVDFPPEIRQLVDMMAAYSKKPSMKKYLIGLVINDFKLNTTPEFQKAIKLMGLGLEKYEKDDY